MTYEYQVIWCGTEIIKLLPNPDPLGRSIYHTASYKRIPGSFWGKGIPLLMGTAQDIANSAGRHIIGNMAIASGPQVDVDMSQINPKTDITTMYAWKVWPTVSKSGANRKAVEFFQPDDRTAALMAVYDKGVEMGQEATGIPPYMYGSDEAAGAGKTASGLSMLINASARGMKESLGNQDEAVASFIALFYAWKMLYDPDDSIKGDCCVEVKGTMGVLLMELRQIRITEFLDRLLHPTVFEFVGPESIMKTLHEYGELLQIDHDNLLPSVEEVTDILKQREESQQQAEAQQAAAMQAEQAVAREENARGEARANEELALKRAIGIANIEKG